MPVTIGNMHTLEKALICRCTVDWYNYSHNGHFDLAMSHMLNAQMRDVPTSS